MKYVLVFALLVTSETAFGGNQATKPLVPNDKRPQVEQRIANDPQRSDLDAKLNGLYWFVGPATGSRPVKEQRKRIARGDECEDAAHLKAA